MKVANPELALRDLLAQVHACRLCAPRLPHAPRPVVQAAASARLLIIGQAPGARVHASGIPWDDRSGERLRHWLGLDATVFYDATRVAIVPMGFCYPGKGPSGDLPPRAECSAHWHGQLLAQLPNVRLTLLIGHHAQRYYLGSEFHSLTETVKAWRQHLPRYFALPHPSPRNQAWCLHNPWFEQDVVPELRRRVRICMRARSP